MPSLTILFPVKPIRLKLRHHQTPHEGYLWSFLHNKNSMGISFTVSSALAHTLLIFYCFDKKLAIELDGSQHFEEKYTMIIKGQYILKNKE
jgi:very-short-patch-repair endonuclease